MFRYPIKIVFPAIIGILGIILSLLSYLSAVSPAMELVELQASKNFRVKLARAQGVLENELAEKDMVSLKRFIASYATDENHRSMIVTNHHGKIIASTNIAYIERDWDEIANENAVKNLKNNQESIIGELENGISIISGVAKICSISEDTVQITKQCGIVYLEESLELNKTAALKSLRSEAIYNSMYILILVLVLMGMFNILLTKRVKKLLSVIKEFSQGNLDGRSSLTGKDEIATIGQAMDSILTQIHETKGGINKALKIIKDQRNILEYQHVWAIIGPDGLYVDINIKFTEIFGYTKEDILKENWNFFLRGPHPDEFYDNLRTHLKSGKIWTGDLCSKAKDGSKRWTNTTIAPLINDDGTIYQYVFLGTEVTDRKKTEEQLMQSHKMQAVGQLTGGIAHDFNNILGIVLGNLEILQTLTKNNSRALKHVNAAYKGANRGAKLTEKLLGYSRQRASSTELCQINDFIHYMGELIEKSLTATTRLFLSFDDNIWPIDIDCIELESAILNITLNAKDAMPEVGELTIKTRNIVINEHHEDYNPDIRKGEYVLISFSDTGVGMTQQTLEHVLDPFYTTKPIGKGTGLGLSMVHGFVQRAGGLIKVTSELGQGSIIKLFIPRAIISFMEETTDKYIDYNTIPRGTETILIVDDELQICYIARNYLESLGYTVITTSDADYALIILKSNTHVDLLFNDIVMPGNIVGYQLALAAKVHKPDIKILLTTGFSKGPDEQVMNDDEMLPKLAQNILRKPYSKSDLALAIRRTFNDGN